MAPLLIKNNLFGTLCAGLIPLIHRSTPRILGFYHKIKPEAKTPLTLPKPYQLESPRVSGEDTGINGNFFKKPVMLRP